PGQARRAGARQAAWRRPGRDAHAADRADRATTAAAAPAAAAQLAAGARSRQGPARARRRPGRGAPRLPPRLMRRRGSASIVANPVLVGAVTTLVVVVAVFLSYNANNGLPFVPTRAVFVEIKNGSELVKGNDVREGGF